MSSTRSPVFQDGMACRALATRDRSFKHKE